MFVAAEVGRLRQGLTIQSLGHADEHCRCYRQQGRREPMGDHLPCREGFHLALETRPGENIRYSYGLAVNGISIASRSVSLVTYAERLEIGFAHVTRSSGPGGWLRMFASIAPSPLHVHSGLRPGWST